MKLKPVDSNAATHLIRCALGGEFTITYITNSNIVLTYMFTVAFVLWWDMVQKSTSPEAFVSFDVVSLEGWWKIPARSSSGYYWLKSNWALCLTGSRKLRYIWQRLSYDERVAQKITTGNLKYWFLTQITNSMHILDTVQCFTHLTNM